jgi:DNA/RNA-binding domain of Phe-tRNA-synthetase-like protein
MSAELQIEQGWLEPELRDEFPELALYHSTLQAQSGRSPREVKERLRLMSNRFTGAKAVNLRQEPVPWAYRVFFRQVGIDPDERRTAPEEIALERMKRGGFRSQNLLDDAIVIATVETGVPVIAFDADRVDGDLGLRLSTPRERLGGKGRPLSSRQIVIADSLRAVGVLFGELAEARGVHPETERITLVVVRVKGVPQVSLEEALWTVTEIVAGPA